MKKSLPANAKIAKEAKDLVQEATCELIAFITSEANERCATEKRKTINGDDVLYAMKVLGFENYEEVCRVWLSRYRMVSGAALPSRGEQKCALSSLLTLLIYRLKRL